MTDERPPDITIIISEPTARELYALVQLPRIVAAEMSGKARDELLAVLEALAPPPEPLPDPEAARYDKRKAKNDDEQKKLEEEFDTKLEKELDTSKRRKGGYGA